MRYLRLRLACFFQGHLWHSYTMSERVVYDDGRLETAELSGLVCDRCGRLK